MDDIENAKSILQSEKLTCVLCKGETVYKSTKNGIMPMISYIEKGTNLCGFSAADKVVGKAAALLFVYAKVKKVYAEIMSKSAVNVFEQNGVNYSYNKLVDSIKNCVMETAVANITEPKEAFKILCGKIKQSRIEKEAGQNLGEGIKKLGFGLMRLPVLDANDPTSFDYAAIEKMVDRFIANGFTHFDTAYVYHNEKSEELVKKLISSRYPREAFQLATKLPMWQVKTYDDQPRLFNEQLEKCGVEYFDYYLLHSLNRDKYKTVQKCRSFEFGLEQKAAGRIKNLGFSFHDDAEFLDEVLTAHPETDFVLMQINYLDWTSLSIQSRRCYEIARKHNVPIIVMEPIKGGQLAAVPEEAEKLMKEFNPDMSAASWAVRYAASLEGVFMVLSGMGNLEQLEDNMSYMKDFSPLTEKELEILDNVRNIIEKNTAVGCTGCGYCVKDCPQKIAIPDYFAIYNEHKRYPASWNPMNYYANISKLRGKASSCVKCGLCEEICPQKLKVTQYLADVAKAFEEDGE